MERHFEMATERKYKLLWKQYLNILGCLITREKTIQTKVYNTCKNKITYQWIIRWQRVFWKILEYLTVKVINQDSSSQIGMFCRVLITMILYARISITYIIYVDAIFRKEEENCFLLYAIKKVLKPQTTLLIRFYFNFISSSFIKTVVYLLI